MSKVTNISKIKLLPAQCGVDLGDGSERGEYVSQDYILWKLGRPHRNINLMYCYYPLDKGWPERASVAFKDIGATFAWDFPYDDYFPYEGGINGHMNGEPFKSMRDVRKHGQDVTLTLTVDCAVSDEHLIKIAKEISTFGRMQLRINHEATGNWFAYNKRYSYGEVADFYVRFHNIIKREAPHVQTVLCIGSLTEEGKIEYEKEFTEAIKATDIWSGDFYLALHWGWPYDVAERGGNSHKRVTVDSVNELNQKIYDRFKTICDGKEKQMVISEFNADGDVTGPVEQAEMIKEFYTKIRDQKLKCYNGGVVMYQFRDRGRLGLEIEDPNNSQIGIEQPLLNTYKEIIHDEYFKPGVEKVGAVKFPQVLRWGSAEDSEGISMEIALEGQPVFFEGTFEEGLNLMIEVNGRWFYKAPGVKSIDMMTAFHENPVSGPKTITMNVFAPPATGENDPSQGEDWKVNYYTTINEEPKLRIRYEATESGYYRA